MKKSILIPLIALAFASFLMAQDQWRNLTFTNGIYDIEYDGTYWWLGTQGGLIRFEESSRSIKVYNRGNSDILSNHIRALAMDENGHIWIASEYGLSKFDGKNFTHYTAENSDLRNNNIKLMEYEQNKGLWVVTDSALTFFDGTNWHHFRTDDAGDSLKWVCAMYPASPYGLLFAIGKKVEFINHSDSFVDMNFTGSGFYRITGVGYDWLNNVVVATDYGFWVSDGTGWTQYHNGNSPMPANTIVQMKCTPGGDIYLNHGQNGFSVWHSYNNSWNIIPDKDGHPYNYLITLFVNQTGDQVAFSLAWPSCGFVVADHPDTWTYTFSETYDVNTSPLRTNEVENIVVKNGIKYIGTRGVIVLDRSNHLLHRYDSQWDGGEHTILFNPIKHLAVDAWNNIWCSDGLNINLLKISGDHVYEINQDSLGITNPMIKGLQWESIPRADGKPDGILWAGVYGADYQGIAYYDSLWHTFPDEHPQYPFTMHQLVRDEAGIRWFAANAIYSYDGNEFTRYWYDAPLRQPTCVVRDKAGNIWFGGTPEPDYGWKGGLARYLGGDKWLHLTTENSSLPDDYITSMVCDTTGNLWIGTQYGGLVKMDAVGNMEIFNRDNSPLDNNWIVKLAVDTITNDLWVLNRESGIFIFNKQGFTAIEPETKTKKIPLSHQLLQNYPNPFNPTTNIHFVLSKRAQVKLQIFDVLGRKVAELLNEHLDAGEHNITFKANGLPSGVYIYRLQAGNFVQQRKMVLMK